MAIPQQTQQIPQTIPQTMKALVIDHITPASEAHISDAPVPQVRPGWLLIRVRGIGMNHSEQVLRLEEIERDYIHKPVIPGIECVGEVADPGDTSFELGQRVCALMGGMGRSFDGSYAQYVLMPAHHVFALPKSADDLSWETLAAIPETFYTAWGSLFQNLRLDPQDTLLIRGGTCGLGYASLQIAHALGCRVIATARRPERFGILEQLGCDQPIVDDGHLADKNLGATKILELVGTSTLLDSLHAVQTGGIVCHTGILGGEEPLHDFYPLAQIPNGVYLTGFHSNWPDQDTIAQMFDFVAAHSIQPVIAHTFDFDHLIDAISFQDAGGFDGKIVIIV